MKLDNTSPLLWIAAILTRIFCSLLRQSSPTETAVSNGIDSIKHAGLLESNTFVNQEHHQLDEWLNTVASFGIERTPPGS
jgi:hypothetical protein